MVVLKAVGMFDKISKFKRQSKMILASLYRLSSDLDDDDLEAIHNDVIEPLEDLDELINDTFMVTEGAVSKFPRRVRWRKMGQNIRWVCCTQAVKSRTRRGKAVWKAWCRWKKGSKSGGMTRVVGRGDRPKPNRPLGKPSCP